MKQIFLNISDILNDNLDAIFELLSSFRNDTFPESKRRDRNQANVFKLQCLWVSQNVALSFQR